MPPSEHKAQAHLRQRLGSDASRLFPDNITPPQDISQASSEKSKASPLTSRARSSTLSGTVSSSDNSTDNFSDTSHANDTNAATTSSSSHRRHRSSAHMSPILAQQNTFLDTGPRRLNPQAQPSDLYTPSSTPGSLSIPVTPTRPSMDEITPIEKYHARQEAYAPPVVPTWTNMPHKPQLAILCLSRFVDFFQMASLQTYMVHQLKSFDPNLPDSVISHQAGVLQGAFTAAQIITSILWGRLADRPTIGRKLVLNIGLVGTGISMLGVGFSTTYTQAVTWRVLGGAINGTVGAARTMVAETVDKRWHPRAFLLLPAAFNIANVAGPILGGLLVEPVQSLPRLFGEGSLMGGAGGVQWMKDYPFALANMLSTMLLFAEAFLVTMFLKETLRGYKGAEWDAWSVRRIVNSLAETVGVLRSKGVRAVSETAMLKRGLLSAREDASVELDRVALTIDTSLDANEKGMARAHAPPRLPFRRIWTSNVLWTLASIAIFDFHMGAFNNLWILFLSSSRSYVAPSNSNEHNPTLQPRGAFKFSGGLAFPPATIGFAMAILGFIGVALQFLLYPWANGKFGLMRCFRFSLFLFPLAYFLAPFIGQLPSSTAYPEPAAGFWVWMGIALVLTMQVAARTFALPASIILTNNSSPHPSVLGTIHGLGQADSATFRTIGPILAGGWYGTWLERGVVGMAWWIVAAVSVLGCVASFYVRNGTGHEIFLEGEEEAEDEWRRRRAEMLQGRG